MSDEEQPLTTFEKKVRLPKFDHGDNPFRIPNTDPLLAQLYKEHPDRRYENVKITPDKRWRY